MHDGACHPEPLVRIPLRFLRAGDFFAWAAPVELFNQIPVAIRRQSPRARVVVLTTYDGTEDIHRAVRFIRHHAAEYGVKPDQFGIFGASAGDDQHPTRGG